MTRADAARAGRDEHAPRRVERAGEAVGEGRRSLARRGVEAVSHGVVSIVLGLLAVFWLVPTFGLLVASLRPESANESSGWWTVLTKPSELTLQNYRDLAGNATMIASFWNTVKISVPVTILVVLLASLAGYAFAWLEFPGRDAMFLGVVGLLVVPLQIGLIPVATLFNALGIFGSTTAVVLYHVAFGLPFAIFLLRNFFTGIPRDLLEAARMDGASEVTIFGRVILPLGAPAIASLAIFQFIWVWNDLLVALIFGNNAKPLTVAIREQTRQFGSNIDVLSSAAFLSMIVPLIVFSAFQRYFVQGVLAGSVK